MNKYIVLYHAPPSAMKSTRKASPKERKKGMALWMVWAKRCGRNLISLGAPLGKGVKLTRKGSSRSNRNVVGYSILKAKNMQAAKKLLKGHPHLGWKASCQIEVHETLPMPK